MKKWLIFICLIFLTVESAYAYSMAVSKIDRNGNWEWELIEDHDNFGALNIAIGYDKKNYIYIYEYESLIQLQKNGVENWRIDAFATALVADDQENIYYDNNYEQLEKHSKSGDLIWQASIENYYTDILAIDAYNNIFVVGSMRNDTTYSDDYLVMYLNAVDGEKIWSILQNAPDEIVMGGDFLHLNQDRSFFVTGCYYEHDDEHSDDSGAFIALHDYNGELVWHKVFEILPTKGFAADSEMNLYLANDGVDKFNADGEQQWHLLKNDVEVFELTLDSEENIIGMGRLPYDPSHYQGESPDVVTFKIDPDGELIWWKVYEPDYIIANKLLVDSEDNVIVAGFEGRTSGSIPIDTSFFALKLDPDGELLWHETYQPFEGKSAYASDAVLDDEDNIYIAGYSYDYTDGDDDDEPGCGCF